MGCLNKIGKHRKDGKYDNNNLIHKKKMFKNNGIINNK